MNSKSKVSFKKRTISLCLLASLIGFTPIKTNSIPILQHVTAVKGVQASEQNISKVDYSKDVIYQIITDRFYDGDKSNNPSGNLYDANKNDWKKYWGGDWKGIADKINSGYFSKLGVTALWISQPVENIDAYIQQDGEGAPYHGYWAKDYKKTNPYFGSLNDFKDLVQAAHSHNLKIIIDFAPNHTSPARVENTGFGENGALYDNGKLLAKYNNDSDNIFHHNGSIIQDDKKNINEYKSLECCTYKNLFDLCDLNQQNKTVDKYLKDAINLWIDQGIDGIRLDAVKHMAFGWQKSFMSSINAHKPVFTFGEWSLDNGNYDAGNTNFANNSGMSLLDFRFARTIDNVFRYNSASMYDFNNMIASTAQDYEDVNSMVTFIDCHDFNRFSTGSNNSRTNQALVALLTSRGIPAVYYGTEHYMSGDGDPYCRGMMSNFDTNSTAFNIISKLSALRKNNTAIGSGTTKERWINDDVYIYERQCGKNVALVAINKGNTDVNVSGLLTAMPNGNYSDVLQNMMSGNSITVTNGSVNNFTLRAGASAVWSYTTNSNSPTIGNVQQQMAKPGQEVTVIGDGFGSSKGAVYFGNTAATVTSWSDDAITVKVPSISAGKVNVKVKTASGAVSNVYKNYDVISGDLVSVRFSVNNASTYLGQNVYLVGNVPELGSWNTDKAIGPFFNQIEGHYPNWYYDVAVPAGTKIEFKFIKVGTDSYGKKTVEWQSGDNRTYTVPYNTTGQVTVNW